MSRIVRHVLACFAVFSGVSALPAVAQNAYGQQQGQSQWQPPPFQQQPQQFQYQQPPPQFQQYQQPNVQQPLQQAQAQAQPPGVFYGQATQNQIQWNPSTPANFLQQQQPQIGDLPPPPPPSQSPPPKAKNTHQIKGNAEKRDSKMKNAVGGIGKAFGTGVGIGVGIGTPLAGAAGSYMLNRQLLKMGYVPYGYYRPRSMYRPPRLWRGF